MKAIKAAGRLTRIPCHLLIPPLPGCHCYPFRPRCADLATKYLTSLYWAFTTTATVGYGDITPKTDKEKVTCVSGVLMTVGSGPGRHH
mgnify:CR=1 FL=1